MNIQKDLIVEGATGRPTLMDLYLPEQAHNCPVVVFAHGFKGFKDWGHWHQIAKRFVDDGFAFVKFNFSHNGTTLQHPLDFADLEAFGQNNYSKELADLDAVINWIYQPTNWPQPDAIDTQQLTLIGHSRGGGIGIVKAANDERIRALVTWASVSQLDYSWHGQAHHIEQWQKEGVVYILNGRTRQMMPLNVQLYEDFVQNAARFSIEQALKKRADLPMLIIHGTADPAVGTFAAEQLKQWHSGARLEWIEEGDHVFGGKHPFPPDQPLPLHTEKLLEKTVAFLKSVVAV